jgi:hypothetical protein
MPAPKPTTGVWLVLMMLASPAAAFLELGFSVRDIESPVWSAEGVALTLGVEKADSFVLSATIETLQLPEPMGRLSGVRVQCPHLRLTQSSAECDSGSASFEHDLLGRQRLNIAFSIRGESGGDIRFSELRLAEGTLSGKASWAGVNWSVELDAADVAVERALALLEKLALPTFGMTVSGKSDFNASLRGKRDTLVAASGKTRARSFAFTDAESLNVGEGLGFSLSFDATRRKEAWDIVAGMRVDEGQVYLDPVYIEVPVKPVRIDSALEWNDRDRRLVIKRAHIDHPGALEADLQADVVVGDVMDINSLRVDMKNAQLPGFYETYLRPFLIGTDLDELETEGRMAGNLAFTPNEGPVLTLSYDDVYFDDRRDRFGAYGLIGSIEWRERGSEWLSSRLAVDGGHLFEFDIGAAELLVETRGRDLRLANSVKVPVLDGDLAVQSFEIEGVGTSDLTWAFDALLTPVSMTRVSAALDWPLLKGTLAGMIPDVHYADGEVTVGGALLVKAFEGELVTKNLRLVDPFGLVPRLYADIVLNDLDLGSVTSTFKIGSITGRLEGHMKGLELVAWRPVAFDALFRTPPDDRSRHRISQNALDDLTSIGGGVQSALQATFIRGFDTFRYNKLGLSCRLKNGICHMDGVAPANGGYYIVQGAGLPRVDLIGQGRYVDWDVLLDRLMSLPQGGVSIR